MLHEIATSFDLDCKWLLFCWDGQLWSKSTERHCCVADMVNFCRFGPNAILVPSEMVIFGWFWPNVTAVVLRWSSSVKIDQTWLLCCWYGQLLSIWTERDSCAEWDGQLWSISTERDCYAVEMVIFSWFRLKLKVMLSDKFNFGRFGPNVTFMLLWWLTLVDFNQLNLVLSETANFGRLRLKLKRVLKWRDLCAAWDCNFGWIATSVDLEQTWFWCRVRRSASIHFNQTWLLCCWDGQLWLISNKVESCAADEVN